MTSLRRQQPADGPLPPWLRRLGVVVGASVVLTGSLVAVKVAAAPEGEQARASVEAPLQVVAPRTSRFEREAARLLEDRRPALSRSARRVTLKVKPKVTDRKFRTAALNLWRAPKEKGRPLRVLREGGSVGVTGVRRAGFAQILMDGQVRWVNAHFLADKKPSPEAGGGSGTGAAAGVSTAPCPDGSGTEAGLTSSAVRLYRAACAAFPALSSYGGWDGHGEHSSGRAIDFMVSDAGLGQALAEWARAHASELGLYDVIWAQRIWTPVRAGEGWRYMPDRGSSTANHYDHVHISVN